MHDPMTVAFEIRYPWRKYGKGHKHFPDGYREAFATIWHVDPEQNAYERGTRSDDTCGWFTPPSTPEMREAIAKLGRDQFSTLFARRHWRQQGESFAESGNEPTTYDAVYWAWRAIKHLDKPGWMYGNRLSRSEEEAVRLLASNPVDNVQSMVGRVASREDCAELFCIIHREMRRRNRPWYRHPRWHLHHWQIQIHPVQQFKRWAFTRCASCGGRFKWGESGVGTWNGCGPGWFRREWLRHMDCPDASVVAHGAKQATPSL